MRNKYPVLDMNSKFNFGKFKNKFITEIINIEPDYILFLDKEGVVFAKEVLLEAKILNKNKKYKRLRKVSTI